MEEDWVKMLWLERLRAAAAAPSAESESVPAALLNGEGRCWSSPPATGWFCGTGAG